MRKVKCIEHQWIEGDSHIPTIFKYGSFTRAILVCEVCGKRRLFL